MEFVSTNKSNTKEWFAAFNEAKQVVAEIVCRDWSEGPPDFWACRMLRPGVGGKAQGKWVRNLGAFPTFEDAKRAIEADLASEGA